METMTKIKTKRTTDSQIEKIDWNSLEFGKNVSDHMFSCQYKNGHWQEPSIIPFQNLSLSPFTLALHYGQSIFEGMKAFQMKDGGINIFRIEKHHERLNRSMARMCMPAISYELFTTALEELVQVDKEWVPKAPGTALYIRPLVFASEAKFGVKVSDEYQFLIMTAPVPALYQKPIRVKVERNFIRAAKGGTGYAKCAGNYGGVFYPTQLAKNEGFDAVVWTDASEHEYLEESGVMNLMFVLGDKLVTPPLSDSILDGVTRDSLLQLARDMQIEIEERRVSITEIIKAFKDNTIKEAFGAGTAAVVAPISEISIDNTIYHLPAFDNNAIMLRLKERLERIRTGNAEDVHGWNGVIG
jgi:branched-chain amino acid aminotransferase